MTRLVRKFVGERGGNFALNTAILAPILLAGTAAAVDFSAFKQHKSSLQSAADAAALATVREAGLKGWSQDVGNAVAQAVLDANINTALSQAKYTANVNVDVNSRTAEVVVTQDYYPYFSASFMQSPQISVSAKASGSSGTNICVIGLNENETGTVGLIDSSKLLAKDCAVYSNSTAIDGVHALDLSSIDAQLICSAGGTKRTSGNFKREPVTNCPKIADPLIARPAPTFGSACDFNNVNLKTALKSTTLSPGVYCGGISLAAKVSVTLEPGEYIIKDGPLQLGSNASLYGRGVGFYFTGTGANFSLQSGSTVDLEAPETGPLAGLLFYQDRSSAVTDFILRSDKASVMVGTIYLPNGNFIIDTGGNVADTSAYTAIVSRTLSLLNEPNVVLNTDYDKTTVPVPAGIGGQSGNPRLVN